MCLHNVNHIHFRHPCSVVLKGFFISFCSACPTRRYLHGILSVASAEWAVCEVLETVAHFVCERFIYEIERKEVQSALPFLENLPFTTLKFRGVGLSKVNSIRAIKTLLGFLEDTRLDFAL